MAQTRILLPQMLYKDNLSTENICFLKIKNSIEFYEQTSNRTVSIRLCYKLKNKRETWMDFGRMPAYYMKKKPEQANYERYWSPS